VPRSKLKRILLKKKETASIISDILELANDSITVWDVDGFRLFGPGDQKPDGVPDKNAIRSEDEIIGWVSGSGRGHLMSEILSRLVTREAEVVGLLDEVLDLYRQINLLFNLSEKLTTSIELATVTRMILDEASRLIQSSGGSVMLLKGDAKALQPVAIIGKGIQTQTISKPEDSIVGVIATSAQAEIVNDAPMDKRYVKGKDSIRSLIHAPLKSKNKTIGSIILVNTEPVTYTAADLNLLNTLTSQGAPAVENAILYEETLRKAKQREKRLQQQIQALRIELDETRQKEKVAEITESEYFQRLRDQADNLRNILGSG
jgi:transcriptional regulator with GAF, ATPase, and Fis domain